MKRAAQRPPARRPHHARTIVRGDLARRTAQALPRRKRCGQRLIGPRHPTARSGNRPPATPADYRGRRPAVAACAGYLMLRRLRHPLAGGHGTRAVTSLAARSWLRAIARPRVTKDRSLSTNSGAWVSIASAVMPRKSLFGPSLMKITMRSYRVTPSSSYGHSHHRADQFARTFVLT